MSDTRYTRADKYDKRQRLVPSAHRLTHAAGAALLKANQTRGKAAWASRMAAKRLIALGLAIFLDSTTTGRKSKRVTILILLTTSGIQKAIELFGEFARTNKSMGLL